MNGITRFDLQKQATQEKIAHELKRIADLFEKVHALMETIEQHIREG